MGVIFASMAKPSRTTAAAKSTPTLQNGKVRSGRRNRKASEPRSRAAPSPAIPPRRTSNLDRRTREYLTPAEVERLLQASGKVGRHGARDRTLILLAYRHALRVSELVTMRWEQIDLKAAWSTSRDSRTAWPRRTRSAGPSSERCASSAVSIRSRLLVRDRTRRTDDAGDGA